MSEDRQKEIREAGLKSRAAMAWLRDHHLPANPICYTLAYQYLHSDNASLRQALDNSQLHADDYLEQLKTIYQNTIVENNAISAIGNDDANRYVNEAMSLLSHSQHDLDDFCQVMEKLTLQLEQATSHQPSNIANPAKQLCERAKAATKALSDASLELHDLQAKYVEHQEVASKDELTQLLDKEGLLTTLKEAVLDTENFPMSVLRIDLDQFRLFNETNGKIMSDAVLKHLARAFTNQLKGTDIICRYESDEFVAVLPHQILSSGVTVAESLRKRAAAISLKKKGGLTTVKVTVSIGVAEFKAHSSFDAAMEKAMKALLRSKDLGRNCVSGES